MQTRWKTWTCKQDGKACSVLLEISEMELKAKVKLPINMSQSQQYQEVMSTAPPAVEKR